MNIASQLKNASANGVISEKKAVAIGAGADELLNESNELLDKLHGHVGMYLGEAIRELQAKMKNQKFNAKEYHYERLPGEQ